MWTPRNPRDDSPIGLLLFGFLGFFPCIFQEAFMNLKHLNSILVIVSLRNNRLANAPSVAFAADKIWVPVEFLVSLHVFFCWNRKYWFETFWFYICPNKGETHPHGGDKLLRSCHYPHGDTWYRSKDVLSSAPLGEPLPLASVPFYGFQQTSPPISKTNANTRYFPIDWRKNQPRKPIYK